jgi:hypothetical protein
VRFSVDRRWATLGVAVVLGGLGGSLLGFVTAPVPGEEVAQGPAPSQATGPRTTHRPRERLGGAASTTTRPRARARPATRARPVPATMASRPAPTTTTTRPPTSTGPTSTTTTTTLGGTTTSGPPSSTT